MTATSGGEAAGGRRSVVAKMPGGVAVGKCRVMWGLEVGVPGREAMGEHWEYVRELSSWLIGFRKTISLYGKFIYI